MITRRSLLAAITAPAFAPFTAFADDEPSEVKPSVFATLVITVPGSNRL